MPPEGTQNGYAVRHFSGPNPQKDAYQDFGEYALALTVYESDRVDFQYLPPLDGRRPSDGELNRLARQAFGDLGLGEPTPAELEFKGFNSGC